MIAVPLLFCAVSAAITVVAVAWALIATGERDVAREMLATARGAEREWRNEALTAMCLASKDKAIRSALGLHGRQAQLERQRVRVAETTAALKREMVA